jgi:hypothetical protein
MIDWIANIIICVAILVAAVLLVGFGSEAVKMSWEEDCAALGKHRSGGKVYVCKLEGKEP